LADFEKVYRVGFDTTKAVANLKKFEAKVAKAEKRLNRLFSSKQLQKGIEIFGRKLDKSVDNFRRATRAANSFGRAVNRAGEASGNRFDMLSQKMRMVERETKRVGKQVAKFLGPAVRKGSERAGRGLDEMGRRGKAAGDRIAMGARRAERGLRRVGVASRSATVSIGGLASKISLLIGTAAGIRSVVGEYLGFDDVMTKAAAKFAGFDKTMQPGTEAFKNFRKEVLAAGVDTEHSAESIAKAVDFWAKAGKTAGETKAVIPVTLDFASANTDATGAALDMARAGDILSDALGQFQLKSTDPTELMANTARISDVMSKAANSANVSAEELFESFKSVGPVMSMVGGDIEETSALLATMANSGIKGSIAGRQLKIAVAALTAPTTRQKEILKELNVETVDAQGEFRGLTTIVGDLHNATADLGRGARAGIFKEIIGRQGMVGFTTLLAEGQTELEQFKVRLNDAAGETQRLAEITRQSARNQIKKFWKDIQGLGFQIINETKLFEKLGNAVKEIDWQAASDFITGTLVPALNGLGKIINNVIIPAIGNTIDIVKTVLTPVLWLLDKLFGKISESGEGLAEVLGVLGALWVAYRVKVMAAMAIGVIQHFVQLAKSISGASASMGVMNTKTVSTTKSLKGTVGAVGKLNSAFSVLAAGAFGWEIGTLIHDNLIDPVMKANHEVVRLMEMAGATQEFGLEKLPSHAIEDNLRDIEKAREAYEKDALFSFTDVFDVGGFREAITDFGFGMAEKHAQKALTEKRIEEKVERREEVERSIFTEVQQRKPGASDLAVWDEKFKQFTIDPVEIPVVPDVQIPEIDPLVWGVEPERQPPQVPLAPIGREELPLEPIESPIDIAGLNIAEPLMKQRETAEESLKLQQQTARETADFQKRMVASATKQAKPRAFEQNVSITNSTTINAPTGSAEDIGRIMDQKIAAADRATKDAVKQAARSVGASEF
jgi:TP901 family phage tail tape measure protein